MSNKFTGFSEEDIKKLKKGEVINEEKHKIKSVTNVKRPTAKITATARSRLANIKQIPLTTEIPEEARLSTKTIAEQKNDTRKNSIEDKNSSNDIKMSENIKSNSSSDHDNIILDKKPINLEEFEAQQKKIEADNNKRKDFLAKALADRTKRTHEEAQRLEAIQQEFKKLDSILSNDVSILRNQIEIASLDFMEAQKRFDKIEKEYLDAKLHLHQKREKKELLTEHLCHIIQQNELRKSKKLIELMNQLDMNTLQEDVSVTDDVVISNISELKTKDLDAADKKRKRNGLSSTDS